MMGVTSLVVLNAFEHVKEKKPPHINRKNQHNRFKNW